MGVCCSCLRNDSKSTIPSSIPSSNYHYNIMESLEVQNSSRIIEEQIKHSTNHWSQVSQFKLDANEVPEVTNVEVFRTLQSHPKWGGFFTTFDKHGVGKLVKIHKFAEGGQAELYDVKIKWSDQSLHQQDLDFRTKWVLKVFKKGTSLRQLEQQWPRGLLQNYVENIERQARGSPPRARNHSDVFHGILLKDGRFAFLMVKEDEDLRQWIDRLMLTTKENECPFSKIEVESLVFKVALGMEWFHNHGIIHRDLKASNVLISRIEGGHWACSVADFECSIGVVGTGFFRAPEILQACKDYSISDKPELFTKESDVYSYGMLCYEILTGKLPFEEYIQNDFDHVLRGERPEVPEYVEGWMRELLKMCWQSNPIDRPSCGKILEVLLANSQVCRDLHTYRKKRDAEKAMGIRHMPYRRVT